MPFMCDELEEQNTNQKYMAVLAQAADAITTAKTIYETAELALNAACSALPCSMFVLQMWHWESPTVAEFSMFKATTGDDLHPSKNVIASLLKQNSIKGAIPDRCQAMLNQKELDKLFPTRKSVPYIQGLKVILPRKETETVVIFLALSGHQLPGLEKYIPLVSTLLNFVLMADSRIRIKQHAANEQQMIARAKHEWQSLIDTLDQMFFLVDESGKVIRANKTLERFGLGQVTNVCGKSILELLSRLGDTPDTLVRQVTHKNKHDYNVDEISNNQRCRVPIFTEWERCWHATHCWGSTEWVITDKHRKRDYQVTMQACTLFFAGDDNKKDNALIMVEEITTKRTAERSLRNSQETLKQILEQKSVHIEEINQRLEGLSMELRQTLEKERKRISSGLHDGIRQLLSAIKSGIDINWHQCDALVREDHDCQLGRVLEKTREALDELHRITVGLQPPMLDELTKLSGRVSELLSFSLVKR